VHTGADEVVGVLREAGVNAVFGIPSIHNIRLYEALRGEPLIRHILCRHEATAAHMADGYARAGNRVGVVVASTGPGTGYAVPALQEAWGSCSPLVLVTTNVPLPKIGKGLGVLHEMEAQDSLFRSITKSVLTVRASADINGMTHEAIDRACSGRPGPVCLEIPTDLLNHEVSGQQTGGLRDSGSQGPIPGLDSAVSLLQQAKQPLVVVGTDAVRAQLGPDVTRLAEILSAPVIATTHGKGVIPEDHYLAFGNAVRKGTVREMASVCDVVLAVGTRLREVDAKRRGLRLPRLIHVDWDRRWVGKNFPTELALIGPVPAILKGLLDRMEQSPAAGERIQWVKEMGERLAREEAHIRDSRAEPAYIDAVREVLPREGILVIDNTQLGYWAEYFYPSYASGGLVGAKGSSTIGFAFAAAMGVRLAQPETPVIAVIGDGGFMYSAQELVTCIRHGIGFPVVVVNDNAYGVIAYLQRNAYGKEFESRLLNPDLMTLAEAFGVEATRVENPKDLKQALNHALESGGPWVIELRRDFPEPPFGRY
jgi:acetolactate synthase-1/2/3 large subunit